MRKFAGSGSSRLGLMVGSALFALAGFPSDGEAQTNPTVYSFQGGVDGLEPDSGLVLDGAGNLYGSTRFGGGGTGCDDANGCGTVYELLTNGIESPLHYFGVVKVSGSDGANPIGELIRDAAGNLYGTTIYGGNACSLSSGCGTVFKVSAGSGQEGYNVLYRFKGGEDGLFPSTGLVRDATGNLYGTTSKGGDVEACPPAGCGTVFKLAPDGTKTVLYSFKGGELDGESPSSSLILDAAGNLYGTTSLGAQNTQDVNASSCCGTVFKLPPDGAETVLHAFTGSDGANPSNLILDAAGNLYGTAAAGGFNTSASGGGTVFKLTLGGQGFTVLYRFKGGADDGLYPAGGLVRDAAGNLYGTTQYGGGNGCGENGAVGIGCGTVFKLAPNGTETVIYKFNGKSDGANPYGSLIFDATGNFVYGTTPGGGTFNSGTVFKVSIPKFSF